MNKDDVVAQLAGDAAQIAALAEALGPQMLQAAAATRHALAHGRSVSISGNRMSGALVLAAGLVYDVFLPPGQAGDVLLLVLAHAPSDDMHGVLEAARGRGLHVVALLAEAAASLAAPSDVLLIIPDNDVGTIHLLMVAVLRTIGLLLAAEPRHET